MQTHHLKHFIIGLLLLIVLGAVGYSTYTTWSFNRQMADLKQKTIDLETYNRLMRKDIDNVANAQNAANRNLNAIREQAANMSKQINTRVLNTTDPKALQDQVNQDTANTFKSLEALTK